MLPGEFAYFYILIKLVVFSSFSCLKIRKIALVIKCTKYISGMQILIARGASCSDENANGYLIS